MRGKPIEVTLTNGQKVEVPRVSPFGAPEGIAEKLCYLDDQIRGKTLDRVSRKIDREYGRAVRLEKMSERCDAFIQHPDTTPAKREEYLNKIEVYDSQIEGALDAIDKAGEEVIEVNGKIRQYTDDVAVWIVTEKLKIADAKSVLDPDVSIDICRAALGFTPIVEGDDKKSPLAPTQENLSGAAG
jgi:hypothetical protein